MSNHDDNEWGRITGNPDNMIVSEALLGRLPDTDFDTDDVKPSDSYLQCTLMGSDGTIISGRTAVFLQASNRWEVSFECSHLDQMQC